MNFQTKHCDPNITSIILHIHSPSQEYQPIALKALEDDSPKGVSLKRLVRRCHGVLDLYKKEEDKMIDVHKTPQVKNQGVVTKHFKEQHEKGGNDGIRESNNIDELYGLNHCLDKSDSER